MNIVHAEYGIIGVIVFLVAIVMGIWIVLDWKKQKNLVDGLNYRRSYGAFNVTLYEEGKIKASVSSKQNNSGPNPKTYDKKILYVNHFSTLNLLPEEESIK